jgi:hypothetical protein
MTRASTASNTPAAVSNDAFPAGVAHIERMPGFGRLLGAV